MEVNELMIGDWLCYEGDRNIQVKGIDLPPNGNSAYISFGAEFYPCDDFSPIPLTPEILEKNGFKKDAFTNLSPDYYYSDNSCSSCCINLNSTCDKSKLIWVENTNTRISTSIEESRYSLTKKPLYVHQLQHALRLCGIKKEIEL